MIKQAQMIVALMAIVFTFSGCQIFDAADDVIRGKGKSYDTKARYTGLAGKDIAIVVNADQDMLYSYPNCNLNLSKVFAAKLEKGIEVPQNYDGSASDQKQGGFDDIYIVPPHRVHRYMISNLYWHSETPKKIAKDLKVQRLVWVELNEFRTHSPDNKILKQGRIIARISVYEADGTKPNTPVYEENVSAIWPNDDEVGEIKMEHREVLTIIMNLFSKKAAGLFFDHTAWKEHE